MRNLKVKIIEVTKLLAGGKIRQIGVVEWV